MEEGGPGGGLGSVPCEVPRTHPLLTNAQRGGSALGEDVIPSRSRDGSFQEPPQLGCRSEGQNPNPHLSLNRLSIFSGSEAQGGVLEWVGKEGWPPTPAAPGLLQGQIHVAFLNVKAEAGISLGGWGQMSETTLLLPWFISLF